MLERVKRAVVESYIGAIALGYLLAEVIFAFANIVSSPLSNWIERRDYQYLLQSVAPVSKLHFQDALPPLIRCAVYLTVWYQLLRWLYMTPSRDEKSAPSPESQ